MAGLCAPLSTLRQYPHGYLRMTRGRCGSLLLYRDGLAPSTPCRSPGALRSTPINRHRCRVPARLKDANRANTAVANGVSRNVILRDMGGAALLSHSLPMPSDGSHSAHGWIDNSVKSCQLIRTCFAPARGARDQAAKAMAVMEMETITSDVAIGFAYSQCDTNAIPLAHAALHHAYRRGP